MEILYAGLWGVICDPFGFDLASADVICRQLGYPGALRVANIFEFFTTTDHVWLTNLDCAGNESTLEDCPHSGFGTDSSCFYDEVGVECTGMLYICMHIKICIYMYVCIYCICMLECWLATVTFTVFDLYG